MPDRSIGATFGASTTQQQRENARIEREREKAERERLEREEQNQLTEEQREEIKEAVRHKHSMCSFRYETGKYLDTLIERTFVVALRADIQSLNNSSRSSISTRTKR